MSLTAERLPACSQDVSKGLKLLKDRYLRWLFATRYAETTIKGSHADLEWFYRFLAQAGIENVEQVSFDTLSDYSMWLRQLENHRTKGGKLSLAHINHRLVTLKQFFKWLANEKVITSNIADDLELPRLGSALPQTILTQEEVRRLLDAPDLESPVGYRDKVLLEVLYSTGVRSAELKRLTVWDVDLKARTLMVREGKGGKDRLLPLPRLAVGYLREYLSKIRPRFAKRRKGGDDGTLFLHYTGSTIDINRLCGLLKRCTALAGIEKRVTAMTLRHSIASHLLENGMDVRYIQEFLGHEKLSTTQIYAKVTLSGLMKHYNRAHPKERRERRTTSASAL